MAGKVKGITIEFRGETTKLDSALKKIQTETRSIDTELKKVKTALKFNPSSVTLWSQRQKLLSDKIKETREKLTLLKNEQKRMKTDGIDKNSKEYRELQREIVETTSKLKTFESESRKIGEVHFRAAAEGAKQIGENLTSAGQALAPVSAAATAIVTAVGALAVKSGQIADDLNTMSKKYSIDAQTLQMYAASADLIDVSVESIAKAHSKLTKSMANAQKGGKSTSAAFSKLLVSYRNIDGSLKDADQVFNDVIRALGRMDNETERDALAMELLGKSAQDLNPLIKDNGETFKKVADIFEEYGLDFVDQETLDRAQEFNDELDTMKAIASVALQTIGAKLAGYLAPFLKQVVGYVGQLANWLATLDPETVAMVTAIAAVVAVAAPLLIVLGQIAFAISSILSLMAIITGPVGLIIVAIAGLIAIGVLLWKNWDKVTAKVKEDWQSLVDKCTEIKDGIVQKFEALKKAVSDTWNSMRNNAINAWNNLRTAASNAFQKIKDAITKPIESVADKIKGVIDKIKGFFPISISKIFNDFHIPSFHLTGEFDLKKRTVPRIEWYAQGGIFNSPSVIGVGEAGSEAVVPLDKLWGYLDAIARNGGGGTTINVYGGNATAREIALEVERVIINDTKRRRLAWQ